MERPAGLRRALLAGAAFLVAFLVIQCELVLGRAVVPFDGDQFFAPYYTLVADFARAGRLCLWNPFVDGGLPDFVEPQTGALSPLQLAFGLVTGGTEAGFRAYLLFAWSLGGFGMLLLGRELGAPAWAGLVVALGFTFSGYQLGHAEHVSWLYSLGLLPFLIVLVDRAVVRRSRFLAAQAGLVWGLALLGGYPAHVLTNGAVAVAWGAGRWLVERRRSPPAGGRQALARGLDVAVVLGLMTLVGLAVMAPILLGMPLEAAGVTSRAGVIPREAAVAQNYLEPRALATLFSPYFARLDPAVLWPATDGSSVGLYPGGLVLVLALFALFRQPRSIQRWCILAAGVLAVLVALGPNLPLRGWLYDHVVLTRFFRHPALFRGYAVFALAVLALLGARDLAGGSERSWKLFAAAVLGAAMAWLAFGRITAIARDDALGLGRAHALVLWPALIALGLWLARAGPQPGLAVACVLLAVLDAGASERLDRWHLDRSASSREFWDGLAAAHAPLSDLAATTGLARERAAIRRTEYGSTFSNTNFLAKQPVLRGYSTLVNDFHREWAELPGLSFAATGPGRIWFAEQALAAPPSPELFAAFVARARSLPTVPLVIHGRDAMTGAPGGHAATRAELAALADLPAAQRAAFELREYDPTTLRLDVDAPADGWLLVTDRWAPGWRAWVNEREVEVLGGDFVFRAVAVTRGRNAVVMRYEPPARFLIVLSWGTIAALVLAAAWRARPSARRADSPPRQRGG